MMLAKGIVCMGACDVHGIPRSNGGYLAIVVSNYSGDREEIIISDEQAKNLAIQFSDHFDDDT